MKVDHLCAKNEVVISQISNPETETELPVPLVDDATLTEHHSLGSPPGPGQLGEDQPK